MTDALKDLDYYAANPDELPTDPEQLAALMAQMSGEPQAESVEEGANDGASEEGEAVPAEEEQAEVEQKADQEEKEAPIASADGKHEIPYSVLRTEREKRKAAEQAMKELQERIAALESSKSGVVVEEQSDDLDNIAEDFPAVKKLLDRTRQLETQLQSVAKRIEQDEAQRAEVETARVRAAVDSNPVLLHWEHNDADRWQAAIEADLKLQNSPAHRGLTLEQRLQKAVEVVEAFYGPDDSAPRAPAKPQTERTPAKPVVAQKVAGRPRTLSDIPGGAVPSVDPLEEFANLSADRLGAQMLGMTPDQISALLNRLG